MQRYVYVDVGRYIRHIDLVDDYVIKTASFQE